MFKPMSHETMLEWIKEAEQEGRFTEWTGQQPPELHTRYGTKHTDASKKLMSEAKKGKMLGSDNPSYGSSITEDKREKMKSGYDNMIAERGHPKGMLGKKHPNRGPADKELKKYLNSIKRKIEQWDLYGNYVKTFESIAEAAADVGGNPSNIKYTADGKHKHAYKYVWRWADESN